MEPVVVVADSSGLVRVLLVPDCHIPYHDPGAWALLMKAGQALRPDIVVCLGDFADFYSVSAHDKNPERAHDLQAEVGTVKERLAELASLNPRRKVYLAGNHEDRLERYLMQRAPALFGSVRIPEVLGLYEDGWEFVPYRQSFRLGKLHLTHDIGQAGRNAHRVAADTFQGSAIIGHTHRLEYGVIGNADGPPILGAMLGWLGDFSRVDYLHQVKARRDWVHGFGVGYMEPNGVVHLQPCPIVGGKVVVGGRLVT